MTETKDQIITEIRSIFATFNAELTSARLASLAYDILDMIIRLNTIEPGNYRKELLALSLTLDRELAYAHEIAKDIYIKNVSFISEEDLIKAKNLAIEKMRIDLESIL